MHTDYIAQRLAALRRNPRTTLRVVAFTTSALAILGSLYLMDQRGSNLGEVFGAFFGL